jgi:hypothetical protein
LSGEVAKLVKRLFLLVSDEENLLDSAVDVEVDVIFSPLHAVGVEAVGVFAATDLLGAGGLPVGIGLVGRAPVSGTVVHVAAAFAVFAAVATRLHDIDLATPWPFAVDVVFGHHPDRGPEPITLRKFCDDLDLTVTDALLALGGETGRADGRNHVAFSGVGANEAGGVFVTCARAVATSALVQVESVVRVHLVGSDIGSLGGEGGDDVKAISVDVTVLVVGGGPVECVVAEAIDLDFASPNVSVEGLEVILVDKAKLKQCYQYKSRYFRIIGVTYISLNVRVDCEESNHTSASKATKDEEADNQVVPTGCLHGLVLEPWLLVLALESVALEDTLRAHVGVCLVEALDGLIWCGTIEVVGVAAILVATDGCRSRHCEGVDDQAQVCGTGLATMSLRNRKVSQQEQDRSKSEKNLTTLSGRVPYGVLAL